MDELESSRSSYRQIFKATGIFGGVQVFSIVINLLRSKIIALFLGTAGMGTWSLLQQPLSLLISITGLGLGSSGIREVAKAGASGDTEELGRTVGTVRRWMRVTGLVGMLLTIVFAPWLSQWSFGNREYAWAFRLLSIVVMLTALGAENDVILKGTRRIKQVAKAGVAGPLAGLAVSIPLFWFFGWKGIPPAIIAAAAAVFLANRYYARKADIAQVKITGREAYTKGREMASIGIMMVLGQTIASLTMFGINIFIRRQGGVGDVGLFQAGMQMTDMSIGLVYTAMAADFFPRLTAVCADRGKTNETVNQQAEVATIVSTPILMGMILFAPLLIRLFLSEEFLPVEDFVHWILLAAMLRAATWTIHWIMLAHGHTKLFLSLVVQQNLCYLLFYLLGYRFFGLTGLGIGYLVTSAVNGVVMYAAVSRKYGFRFGRRFLVVLLRNTLLCLGVFLAVRLIEERMIGLAVAGLLLMIGCVVSWRDLNKRMELSKLLKRR